MFDLSHAVHNCQSLKKFELKQSIQIEIQNVSPGKIFQFITKCFAGGIHVHVRQFLVAVSFKTMSFWDVTPCTLLAGCRLVWENLSSG